MEEASFADDVDGAFCAEGESLLIVVVGVLVRERDSIRARGGGG